MTWSDPEWEEINLTPEEREISDKIDLWHLGLAGRDMSLHEYLGWSWEQYSKWVETGEIPK